jgi:hypothetical protein
MLRTSTAINLRSGIRCCSRYISTWIRFSGWTRLLYFPSLAHPTLIEHFFPQKKGNQAETKPFTNFSVFHDNLITRLKALSQIQLDFDKRVKEAEAKFTEKLGDMRRQLDTRWKQIDKFESSVKAYGEAKATWRRKFTAKEGELEALKVGPLLYVFYPWALTVVVIQIMKATNADLTSQISTAIHKRPKPYYLVPSMLRNDWWWCRISFC